MPSDIFSVICVDVLAVRYDRGTGDLLIGLHERLTDPFGGQLALPGVVVLSGERLADAAGRALDRLDLGAPAALGQLHTFDEPFRDPRGPSLSIALYAAYEPAPTPLPGSAEHASWVSIGAVPRLAFDHNEMVGTGTAILAERLWHDPGLTRALTGPQFSGTDAVRISRGLTGREPHRANLNRDLAKTSELLEAGTVASSGGRPSKLWRWT